MPMKTMSVKLPAEISDRLDELSRKTHRPKGYYVRELLMEYLDDLEDGYLALERINDPKAKYVSHEEVKKSLGLK
jgi:RHH-type rel operon transcriptional repressor/antitoxin RelB